MTHQNRIEARDLYKMELISDSEISPDGNYAVYTVQRFEKTDEKKYSYLWLADIEASSNKIFTTGKQIDKIPLRSPSGNLILMTFKSQSIECQNQENFLFGF